MAKLETSTLKKQKAKKRKNPNPEHEDEVANKSVILEDTTQIDQEASEETNTENTEQAITKKSKKRKNKEKGAVKEKRSKSHAGANDGDDATEHEVAENADDLLQPTLEQLRESEKPENNLAIVTGRQKKKQKHQKLVEEQKGQSTGREKQRNEEYLTKWKNAREEWKFEKLRQISIQQTMFEENILNAALWSIALEYLAGSKGSAKDKVVKMANDVIDEIDKLSEEKEAEEDKLELINSVKYQRARDLLQIFD